MVGAIVLVAFLLTTLGRGLGPLVALTGLVVLVFPVRRTRWASRLLAASTILTVLWALHQLQAVLAPLVAAFLLAYALGPFVGALARRRVPRPLAAGLLMAVVGLVLALVIALILPWLTEAAGQLAAGASQVGAGGLEWLRPWLDRLPQDRASEWIRQGLPVVAAWFQKIGAAALRAAANFGQGLSALASALSFLVITPVLLFYLLVDIDRIRQGMLSHVPPRHRGHVEAFLGELDAMLASYLRGQLVVSACVATATGLLLAIAGVPKAATLGALTGVLNLVPVVGFWIALALALLSATFDAGSPFPLVYWVLAIYIGVQQLESQLLSPRIVGREVGLHPVAILMGIIVFGKLFGFVGVLTAIPLMAIAKMIGERALRSYRASSAFTGGPAT